MSFKKGLILSLFFLIFYNSIAFAQSSKTIGQKANKLIGVLQNVHYRPINIDDHFSNQVIIDFLELLDPGAYYFLQEDVKLLNEFSDSLDDNIEKYSNLLFERTAEIYRKRLFEADTLIDDILNQPLDFSKKELLDISENRKGNYALSNEIKREEWTKLLKARVLRALFINRIDSIDDYSLTTAELFSFDREAIEKVKYKSKYKIQNILEYAEGFDVYIHSAFLNAIANLYDPHTMYFTAEMNKDFEESLSSEKSGFGLVTGDNKNGEIEIYGITFGGPAWFSEVFEKGDIITKVKPVGKEETDLTCADDADLGKILGLGGNHVVDFTVRKSDRRLVTKRLTKSKIESDNFARGFILEGCTKVGYVHLPGFYKSFEIGKSSGCALDVMREIIKLQASGVKGLILDLRDNGGGYMEEAVDIASAFILEGNFAKFSKRGQPDIELKRTSTGITYSDPLIVLVNMSSASASEFLAGILQLYKRAVIVGTNTFGKFTAQNIFPLSRDLTNQYAYIQNDDMGFLKATVEQTYLVNGISYQLNGVSPDIKLPFLFDQDKYRETGFENALKPDTIKMNMPYTPLTELPLKTLFERSNDRVRNSEYFSQVEQFKNEFEMSEYLFKTIHLDAESYRTSMQSFSDLMKTSDSISKFEISGFKIVNTSSDEAIFKNNESKKDVNELILKAMKNDLYIEEAYFIINDLIDLLSKKE